MKKLLSLLLILAVAALGSQAFADDDTTTIWVTKAGDSTAKVTPDKGSPVTVPISFDSGADWDTAHDSYEVSAATLAGLEAKKVSISIGTDGTATFHTKKK
jgi:hypothetical protein